MKRPLLLTLALLTAAVAQEPIAITTLERDTPVDFGKEVFPLLKKNCIACHNSSKAKGQLNLEDPKAILKGGSEGPSIVPGKPEESFLLQVAAHAEEPIMPPEGNKANAVPFTPEELGLIQRWISEGAKGQAPLATVTPEHWALSNRHDYPVYHMALSPDDRVIAASRGQRVQLYDLHRGKDIGSLVDPILANQELYQNYLPAHQDFVQSLAFSPDGWIATGGFRNVKLWTPRTIPAQVVATLPEAITTLTVSANGQWAIAGDSAGHLIWWKPEDPTFPAKQEKPHEGKVLATAMTNTGAYATAGTDGKVRVVAVDVSERVFAIEESVTALILHDDQPIAATVSGKLLVGTTASEWVPHTVHQQAIVALRAHPQDANQVFTASADGTVKQWDLGSKKDIRTITHGDSLIGLAISPDGNHLVTHNAASAKIWKTSDGAHLRDIPVSPDLTNKLERLRRQEASAQTLVDNRKKKVEEREKAWKDEVEKAKKAASDQLTAQRKWDEADLAAHHAQLKASTAKAELDDATANVAALKTTAETLEGTVKAFEEQGPAFATRLSEATTTADTLKATLGANAERLKHQLSVKAKAQTALAALREARQLVGDRVSSAIHETENFLADTQQGLSGSEQAHAQAQAAEITATAVLLELQNEEKDHLERKAALDTTKFSLAQSEDQLKRLTENYKSLSEESTKAASALAAASKAHQQAVENEELALRLSQRASEDSTRALAALTIAEAKLKIQLEATETATKAEPANFTSAGFATDGSTLALGRSQGGTLLYNNVGEHWLGTISDDPATPLAAFSGNLWLAARDKSLQCSKVDESWSWSRTIGSIDDPKQLIDRVTALAFSPNGTVLATGSGSPSRSGELKLWRVSDGSPLLEVTDAHSDTIVGLEFSPDGQYLATASTDRFAKVFRVSDGALVTAFEGHTSHVLDVTWRADGLVLATAGADNVIKLWDFEEKRQIKTIDGYTQEITSVSFADNAEKLVTSSGDKSVRVGNERLDGKEFVYASALSQDGEWLIAGTQDSVVRVWQAKDKKLVQEFTAPGK